MRRTSRFLIALMFVAGCSGKTLRTAGPPEDDAAPEDMIDARASAIDARPIDGPIDARPIDGPIDARPIDGPIDAGPIDGASALPDTVITSAPPALTSATDATLVFNSPNTPNATFECSLDGAPFTACSSPQVYTGLGDGTHTFAVEAVDPLGHVDPTPATATWIIDHTGPIAVITGGPTAGSSVGPNVTFTYTVTPVESPVTYQCSLDSGAFTTCPATGQGYTGLGDGPHTFCVHATDALGNVGPAACVTFTVDHTPPNIVFIPPTPSEGATVSPTPQFEFEPNPAEPAGTTYACHYDNLPAFPCFPDTPMTPVGGFSDGPHSFTVVATDPAGNQTTIVRNVIVISTPPNIAFTDPTPPDGATVSATPSFDFHATNEPAGTTYACHFDALPPFPCTPDTVVPHTFTSGPHSYTVVATNVAGLQTTIVTHFTVDAAVPNIAFVAPTPSEGAIVSPDAQFNFSATGEPAGTTYACQFDAEPTFVCSPLTPNSHPNGLSVGPHSYTVVATNVVGVHATIVRHVIVVMPDLIAPGISWVRPPTPLDGAITGPTPHFEFTVSPAEPNSTTYTCHFDSGPTFTAGCTPNTVIIHAGDLSDGPHFLTAVAVDLAGNSATIVTSVFVDSVAPGISFVRPPTPPDHAIVHTTTPPFEFTVSPPEPLTTIYTCQFDSEATFTVGCTPDTVILHDGPLGDGDHMFTVVATDVAGNPATIVTHVTIDTAPVVTGVDCHPEDGAGLALCVFTVAATDTFTCTCTIEGHPSKDCTPADIDCADETCTAEDAPVHFPEVSPGFHGVTISCAESGGNPGTSTTTVGVTVGDGHVVLIGSDLFNSAPTGPTSPPTAQTVFVNAVSTLSAAQTFCRGVHVLGIDLGSVDATEKANALGALDLALNGAPAPTGCAPPDPPRTRADWYTEINDDSAATLAEALPGVDVVLIFDQNDPTIGPAVTDAFLSELQVFIIGGGVVVTLDGWVSPQTDPQNPSGTPSQTFSMIGEVPVGHSICLLRVFGEIARNDLGTANAACLADELDGQTAGAYHIPKSAVYYRNNAGTLLYDKREPAICAGEGGRANVFHKVIVRCEDQSKDNTVVDSIYGSDDDSFANGDCYLPYKSITHAAATSTEFQLLIEPGKYDAANGEVSPISFDNKVLDGYRNASAASAVFHNLEKFRGDGCFPVEVDAQLQPGLHGNVNGIKVVVPANGIGIAAPSGAFGGNITSNTVLGGAIGIDLPAGDYDEPLYDNAVMGATTAGLHSTAAATVVDPPVVGGSGGAAASESNSFTLNTIGVLIDIPDGVADNQVIDLGDTEVGDFQNIISCNSVANVGVNYSPTSPQFVVNISVAGDFLDNVPPTTAADASSLILAECGTDLCTTAPSGQITWSVDDDGQAANACLPAAASLAGLHWRLPCISHYGSDCTCGADADSAIMHGTAGSLYDVTLHFRGVVEQKTYTGGTSDPASGDYFYTGGTAPGDGYNVYTLQVNDPPQTFFLNGGTSGFNRTFLIDYVETIQVRSGATVSVTADSQDGAEHANHDDTDDPIFVPGAYTTPNPYDGQFVEVLVQSVTVAQ